jgi:hypothetical protein
MSWQSLLLFVALLVAIVAGPKLGADPQLLGTATTIAAAFFVQRKKQEDGHNDGVDHSPEGAP